MTHISDKELEQAAQIKYLEAKVARLTALLQRIADLDPYEDSNDTNECAEADCHYQAKKIARIATTTVMSPEG
ncbi:MAG: hypothetical protein ACXWT0_01810 [Methylobacter sp.]